MALEPTFSSCMRHLVVIGQAVYGTQPVSLAKNKVVLKEQVHQLVRLSSEPMEALSRKLVSSNNDNLSILPTDGVYL